MTDRIAELEAALLMLHGAVTEAFLTSEKDDKKTAAFLKSDREMRRLKLLPPVKS